MPVNPISAEQASYLDVALQTRRSGEPLPACPTCRTVPEGIVQRRLFLQDQLVFLPCDHAHEVDPATWNDWYESGSPWVEIFEAHSREQQRRSD